MAEKHPMGHCGIFQRDYPHQIAEVLERNTPPEMVESNARLIVAAPDLLACLIHLAERDWFKDPDYHNEHVICALDADKVRAAIAKATGKEVAS